MCRFCEMKPNGDIPGDRKDVISESTQLFDMEASLTGTICHNKLVLMLAGPYSNILYREVEIRHCPMCGRELKAKEVTE